MLNGKATLRKVKTFTGFDAPGTYFVDGRVQVVEVCNKPFPNSYLLDSRKVYDIEKIVFPTESTFKVFVLVQSGSVEVPVENIGKFTIASW